MVQNKGEEIREGEEIRGEEKREKKREARKGKGILFNSRITIYTSITACIYEE